MKKYLHRFYQRSYSLGRRSTVVFCVAVFLAILAVLIVSRGDQTDTKIGNKPRIDLLHDQDWSRMAGATQTGTTVKISPLGREIVNQDGSGGQPNPPVNVRGPHLSSKGGFKIDIGISGISEGNAASFYLYGLVPIIYDEWRYQTPQIRIDVRSKGVAVTGWDGSGDDPVETLKWDSHVGGSALISVTHSGGKLSIGLDNDNLGSLAERSIFSNGTVWFGSDAEVGGTGWTLNSLTVQPIKGSKVKVVATPKLKLSNDDSRSLRHLSQANTRKLPIGAAVANYALFSDVRYAQLAASEFDVLTPENELKPQFVHPQPNTYSFSEADSLVDFAVANNMTVHGHTLVFSEANPKWMRQTPLPERHKVMTDHITTVMRQYGTKINEWDVVNEPLSDGGESLRGNIWSAAMGEEYIDVAFKTARAANPAAKLYINEYGLEQDGPKWDNFINLLKRLQSRGVPINGVGFQSHIYERGDEVDGAVLQKHIKTLASMGIMSRISEIDVYGDDASNQAEQYAEVLQACLKSLTCKSFTTWGITDKYGSTTNIRTYPLEPGNDLIWDKKLQPKKAYANLQEAFSHL